MKKVLFIGILVLLLLAAAGIFFYVSNKKNADTNANGYGVLPGSNTTLPSSNGQIPKFTIKGSDGTDITVQNFLARADTKADPDNTGYYNLGYQPSDMGPYLISYISETSFFNIALLQEPIGQSRTQVETYLMNSLGLTKEQLCALNYSISVPNAVSSNYSGMNLGFSSCPNAVKLP